RNIRRDVRLADGSEDFSLISCNLVPRTDFTEGTENIIVRLLDERSKDLFFAHRGDLFRIKRLRIKSASNDDGHAGLHRDLTQEIDIASHVRMSPINDTSETAFVFRLHDFGRHEIHVVHDVRRWRRRAAATSSAGTATTARRRGRQTVRRSSGGS